jgi:hypothetical protein
MNINTLNILADAISDVGSWQWWYTTGDMFQVEFCDVQLYDETKTEKEPHTTDVLAVRFYGHTFAVFLDNLDEDDWYVRLYDDDSVIYTIDAYDLVFDNRQDAERLINNHKHILSIKDFDGLDTLSSAKHLLCARCGEVGFVVGGDEIQVVGKKGKYTEEEIETAAGKWWDYWKEYWRLRRTKDAYPKDYACEITIPVGDH